MTGRPFAIVALAWCVLGACTESQEPELGPLEASASIPIEGGSIELPDGARVEFPAGALSESAEVTFRRLDCGGIYQAASFGSCRYAVTGPENLLAAPYQLRLPSRGLVRASQQTVDGLSVLIGSEHEDDAVVTAANVFGEFTSWSEDAINPMGACVMPDFEPCGGELLGNWTLTGGCGTLEQISSIYFSGPNPYESCDPLDYYRGYPFSSSGGLEFSADSYQMSSAFHIEKHTLLTEDCLAIVGETCLPDFCTLTDGVCECLTPKADGEGASGDDAWSVSEMGTVVLSDVVHRYCVEGVTLTIEWGADTPYYMVYQRQ